jgi:hypothetical protein
MYYLKGEEIKANDTGLEKNESSSLNSMNSIKEASNSLIKKSFKASMLLKKKHSFLKNIINLNFDNQCYAPFKINDRVNIDLDFEIVQSMQVFCK